VAVSLKIIFNQLLAHRQIPVSRVIDAVCRQATNVSPTFRSPNQNQSGFNHQRNLTKKPPEKSGGSDWS
jgi:hypothetical protein